MRLLLTLLSTASMLLAACGGRSTGGAAPPVREHIRIGAFMSLTGDTGGYGLSAANGLRMAIEEVNTAGGINGKRLELFLLDTRSDAAETTTVVDRLVHEHRVHALLGEVVSSRSLLAASIAQGARVPMLTPSSTNPEVTGVGDYIFRSCYTDPFQGAALAKFAADTLHARRAAMMLDPQQSYSVNLARFIREAFEAQGGEIVIEREYASGGGDFSEQLTAIREAAPEVLFVPGYYREAGLIARGARHLGLEVPLVGGDGWDSKSIYEIGGQDILGSFFSSHYSADDSDATVQKFVGDYRTLYGSTPDAFAATAYDAARILIDALRRAPALDGQSLRDALAETRDFPGVTGSITFNAHHDAVKPVTIIKLAEGGKYAVQERITPDQLEFVPGVTPPAQPSPSPSPRRRSARRRARSS